MKLSFQWQTYLKYLEGRTLKTWEEMNCIRNVLNLIKAAEQEKQ